MNQKLLFIFFIASFFLSIRYLLFFLYAPKLQNGQEISFTTTNLNEPSNGRGYNSISVFYSNLFGGQRITITYSQKIMLSYGQSIYIVGKVEKRVLKNNSTILTMSFPEIQPAEKQNNIFFSSAYVLREKVKALYFQTISKTDASLLLGVVLGIRGDFSKTFLANLQSAGVLHVIAASGMNVTMVAAFLFSLATSFLKRQYATVLCIGGILSYAVISGLQASIVRAAVMACFAFAAQLFGRQYIALYGLFLAGFFMLFTKPELIFDIGFQLSILSTIGIVLMKPLFPKQKSFDDIATTLSAQIATLPILLLNFGQYGLLSILINALVLWTVPPLMILGGVGAIIGLVFEPLGKFIIWLSIPFLWFFETVVTYFGNLQFNLAVKDLPMPLVGGYYVILFAIVLSLNKRKNDEKDFISEKS